MGSLVYISSFISHPAPVWRLVWNTRCKESMPQIVIPLPGQLSVHLRCVDVRGLRCVTFREALQCWRALTLLWPKGAMGASCWTKTNYCRLFLNWRLQGVKYNCLIMSASTSNQHIMKLSYLFCQNYHLAVLCGSFCTSDFCCWTVTSFNSKELQSLSNHFELLFVSSTPPVSKSLSGSLLNANERPTFEDYQVNTLNCTAYTITTLTNI